MIITLGPKNKTNMKKTKSKPIMFLPQGCSRNSDKKIFFISLYIPSYHYFGS